MLLSFLKRNNDLKKKIFFTVFVLAIASIGFLIYACNVKHDNLKPTNYTIDVTIANTEQLSAKQQVEYTNNSEIHLTQLSLHLYPNAFREDAAIKPYDKDDAAIVDGQFGGITIKNVTVDGRRVEFKIGGTDKNILYIPIDLDPTYTTVINFEFELKIPKINHRFGQNSNTTNFGNWYPIVCTLENGEFREDPYYSKGDPFFSEVSNYSVNITVPSNYQIASTGMSTAVQNNLDNTKTYKIHEDKIRDFAFVLSDKFEHLVDSVDGIALNYYFYEDANASQNLELIKDVILTFNDTFGKYPYKSITVTKTGFLHGGMEYPQIVFISDILEQESYQEVIVHEIAHQWWYAVVGNDQIRYAWIDEGLSEYSATIFFERNPKYGITKQKRIAEVLSNFLLFCDLNGYLNGKDTVMEKPLTDFKSDMEYVFMVYAKGHLLFDSLRTVIGDKNFFNGLQKYYRDNSFGLVKKENLIASFENSSDRKLESFFDSWIEGKVQLIA